MLEIVAPDALEPGELVARRYRLDRIVGEGGMGVVWAATHVLTEKPCALKFLKGSRATDPRSHTRMLHEARAAGRVRHPNVAQVHDILELPGGAPFIVMELLEGEPLSVRLARVGRLDLDAALTIVVSVMEAVSAAHGLGVVHRDLKPDNVFLEGGVHGVVKVLDFGIAKRFDPGVTATETLDGSTAEPTPMRHGLTTTNSTLGTPSYMAPEQIRGKESVGIAADIWALGLLAYECLTGSRPERDDATGGVIESKAREELRRLERLVPAPIVDAILRMMQLAPADRPSLAEVRATFLSVLTAKRETVVPARGSRRTLGLMAAVVILSGALVVALRTAPAAQTRQPPSMAAVSVVASPATPPPAGSIVALPPAPLAATSAPSAVTEASAGPVPSGWPVGRKEARKSAVPAATPIAVGAASAAKPVDASAATSASSHAIPSYERK